MVTWNDLKALAVDKECDIGTLVQPRKRHTRRWSDCRGKRRYTRGAAHWVSKRYVGDFGRVHAYKCPWCHRFHVGS